jgi:hypothetical protein
MISFKNLIILPTYHGSLDFVFELRKIFYAHPPDVIAVEFPENLRPQIVEGVSRLPKISVVLYYDQLIKNQLYVPIIPSDSLIEALRLAEEYGIVTEFIDLFVKDYTPQSVTMPDSHLLNYIPLDTFYTIVNHELHLEEKANHRYQEQLNRRVNEEKIAQLEGDYLESDGNQPASVGEDAQAWIHKAEEIDDLRNQYMAARLTELMNTNPKSKILVVLGLAHWEAIKVLLEHGEISPDLTAFALDVKAELFNIVQEDLPTIMTETPNVVYQHELFRSRQKLAIDAMSSASPFTLHRQNQLQAIKNIIRRSVDRYNREYHEHLSIHKLKSLFQYMRNLPAIDNFLKPQLFDIVLAAKSIINDDFAWIVWEEAKYYPEAREDPKLEALRFTDLGIFLRGKYFKIRQRVPISVRKLKVPLKPKPKEQFHGSWRSEWNRDRGSLVSYPPEDLFEENYFQHIRQRSLRLLQDQFIHVHEFTSTLMDGIDFRETIRNWIPRKKIYVREERSIRGEIDAVVIIFDKDEQEPPKFPYKMMWYAEHAKESDLAFYSILPGVQLAGPGIARVEMGGLTAFFPPRGIPNIWSEQFEQLYPIAKKKADRLLMAALLYTNKKLVTYIAHKKPSAIFYRIAARLGGVQIVFVPITRFNPVSLRTLRTVHILAGMHRRKNAHKYIPKRRY